MTIILIIVNIQLLPSVFGRIFSEAFGLRQVAAGGFGAVVMNGVKRGLFSNEAGSGSAPCAAATAEDRPPGQSWSVSGIGRLHRHHPDLQLYRHDHASHPGEHHKRPSGYGSAADFHAVPSGRVRRYIHRPYHLPVQLLHVYRRAVLRPFQRGVPVRRQLDITDHLQDSGTGDAVYRRV